MEKLNFFSAGSSAINGHSMMEDHAREETKIALNLSMFAPVVGNMITAGQVDQAGKSAKDIADII